MMKGIRLYDYQLDIKGRIEEASGLISLSWYKCQLVRVREYENYTISRGRMKYAYVKPREDMSNYNEIKG
ncbi:MAG: hypothetical protein LKI18_03705 [Prevotella sp.]|jgi:hypothetical protein|nr:hypothetical protein [Prevotella sp.]